MNGNVNDESIFLQIYVELLRTENKKLGWLDKLVYAKIVNLSKNSTDKDNPFGRCWPENQWLADFFNVKKNTISKCISALVKEGWIRIDVLNGGFRNIYPLFKILKKV